MRLLRGGQFVLSVIALSLISSSFNSVGDGHTSILFGSHATNFGMLITWTSVIYTLYQLLAVEYFKVVPRPTTKATMISDGVMIVLLMVAGIVLASADTCDRYQFWGEAVRCGNLTAGMVFTFLSAAAYFVLFVLMAPDNNEGHTDITYHENTTPEVETDT